MLKTEEVYYNACPNKSRIEIIGEEILFALTKTFKFFCELQNNKIETNLVR